MDVNLAVRARNVPGLVSFTPIPNHCQEVAGGRAAHRSTRGRVAEGTARALRRHVPDEAQINAILFVLVGRLAANWIGYLGDVAERIVLVCPKLRPPAVREHTSYVQRLV